MTGTPHVVGYQCGGTIREVGADVRDRTVGQRVVATMASGSHAELAAVPAGSTWVVPDDLDLTLAACVPIAFGTADDCLFEFGRLRRGETVLVQAGAGGVGIAAIQLAKRAGATVLATASSPEKLERLTALGLDHGIDYRAEDFAEVARGLTGGQGRRPRGRLRRLHAPGQHPLAGLPGPDLLRRQRRARRPARRRVPAHGREPVDQRRLPRRRARPRRAGPRQHRALLGEVAAGDLTVVVDRTYPLAEAAAAHARMEDRQAFGRVVLVP
jgi:NADPH2:quinone reductase